MFQQAPILTEPEFQMFPNLERHSSSANGGRSRTRTYDLAHVRRAKVIPTCWICLQKFCWRQPMETINALKSGLGRGFDDA